MKKAYITYGAHCDLGMINKSRGGGVERLVSWSHRDHCGPQYYSDGREKIKIIT